MERQRPSTIYLLHQTSQGLRSRLEQALRPLGVTGLQYTILGLLARHEGLSSADLSRRFFVTQQTMNQVIAGMTKRGLIMRVASRTNRRILRMTLTTEGVNLLASCEMIAAPVEEEALSSVPSEHLEQMRQHLRLLLRQLRTAGGDANVVVEPLYNAGFETPRSNASSERPLAPSAKSRPTMRE